MAESSLKDRVFVGVFWSLLEQLGSKAIALVIEIVLARLLMPEEYGIVAIAAVFITIANTIIIDGMSLALVQKEHADNIDFSTGFFLNLAVSIGFYVLIFCIAPFVADFYETPALCDVLRVLGLSVPVSSVNSIQRAFATREMIFKRFFVSTTIGNMSSGVLSIIAAYAGFGVWALVLQTLTAAVFDTVILWFTVKWRPNLVFSFDRLKGLWSFGWKILTSNLLYQGCLQLRALIIGKTYSSSDLAYFNRGELIPALIACTADKAIQTALFPAMSQVQSNHDEVRAMLRRFVKVGCYVIFPSLVILAVVANPLVEVLLTEKWLPCVPYIWVFCGCYAFQTLQSASLLALRAIGRSGTTLIQDCVKRSIDLMLLFASIPFGPLAMAFSCLIGSVFAVIVNTYPCRKVFGYGILAQLKDVLPIACLSILCGLVSWPIAFLGLPALLQLILQTVVALVVFIGVSLLTKNDSLEFITTTVRGVIAKGKQS